MNNNFSNLIERFKEINERGYIKGINNNMMNACGMTFEHLLGKEPDSKYLPDYKDIEIKCTQRFSRFGITLFSLAFDGPDLYESNYLLQKYGRDDDAIDKKVLYSRLKYKEKILVYDKYYFELDIDYNKKMILINIYDLKENLKEKRGFLDFETIEGRIITKIKNLAVIYASKKKISYDLYFRYYKIMCYTFHDFHLFLKLLENNTIKVCLDLRISRNKENIGINKSKNILFRMHRDDIGKLFTQLYSYEN